MIADVFVSKSTAVAGERSSWKDRNDALRKNVARLSGSDRENASAFLGAHGPGKRNATWHRMDGLAAVTDSFGEPCVERADDKAQVAGSVREAREMSAIGLAALFTHLKAR